MTCISPAPRAGCAIIPAPVEAGRRDLRSRTGQWVGLPSVTAPEGSYFKVLGTAFRRDDEVKL